MSMHMTRFKDRTEAGRLLARKLDAYRHRDDVRVLALPRGGIEVRRLLAVAGSMHAEAQRS